MSCKSPFLTIDNSFTFGGAINSLSHMLKAFDRERFEPIVVSGQPDAVLTDLFPDITFYNYLPKLPWINNRIYKHLQSLPPFKLSLTRKLLNVFRFCYWGLFIHIPEAVQYARLGRKHKVELVHLNNILGSQVSGILAAKILGVPCVAHLRDFEEVHTVTKFYARFIDHHIAISNAIRENIFQLGVPEEKITLVHDAIDLETFNAEIECDYLFDEFRLDNDQPRFGIFGRVIEWKGIREFIDATKLVVERFSNAKAFIVGGVSDGDEVFMQEMVQLVGAYGLEDNVVFTGFRSDVPALMKFMDIIVHASNTPEPFGMVLIEAMAMGKAVVATKAGGPIDIIVENETGLLVPPGDSVLLSEALFSLIENPNKRSILGSNGLDRVLNIFGSKNYAEKMELIFCQVNERPVYG